AFPGDVARDVAARRRVEAFGEGRGLRLRRVRQRWRVVAAGGQGGQQAADDQARASVHGRSNLKKECNAEWAVLRCELRFRARTTAKPQAAALIYGITTMPTTATRGYLVRRVQ